MLQYVIAGLVMGGLYALSAASLVMTHRSAGIFNFSFAAMAYFVARAYYFLHTQHGWGILPSAVISIFVIAPALGIVLYFVLFRHLRLSSTFIKVVATLGLSVCGPPLATLLFGNITILQAPGLAPEPVRVFHPLGVPVTADQLIVYACVIFIGATGAIVLRYSAVGLRVRATVDSPAMTSLTGTSPNAVAIGVWAFSTFLAGLVGVLSAPIVGLDSTDFTTLMVAAFAAVIAARLRSMPVAVAVGLGMGVAGSLVQRYLPPSSSLTAAVLPSIPFLVAAGFLAYNTLRRGRLDEATGVGGALDRAITPQSGETPSSKGAKGHPARQIPALLRRRAWEPSTLVLVAASGIAVYLISPFWTNYLAQGAAFAVIFLSYTLVTGEGGMIWLCQITFAGVGALTAAQLATDHGWPVAAALVVGGLLAVPIGVLLSLLTSRLGQLYIALVTLTFGFLMDQLVFARNVFAQRGLGVTVTPPAFADTDATMTLFGLAVFLVIAYFAVNIRRSTTGLALNAVRWSEPAARTIGLNPRQSKMLIAGAAAFAAAFGGGLLALANGTALPSNYTTLGGIILLATLVTSGVRSNAGALLAGMTYTLLPAVMQVYLPASWTPLPTLLFGLGAVYIATNSEGWIPEIGDQLTSGAAYLLRLAGLGSAQELTLSETGSTAARPALSESRRP